MYKSIRCVIHIIHITALLLVTGCNEEEPFNPLILTGETVEIGKEGIKLTGIYRNLQEFEIQEYGIIWSINKKPTLENSLSLTREGVPSEDIITFYLTSALQEDTTYHVRSYLKYEESIYYGNIISFFSLGTRKPIIKYYKPSSAFFGDTIEIVVENCQGYTDLPFYFNSHKGRTIGYTDSSFYVKVPKIDVSYGSKPFINLSTELFGASYTLNNSFQLSAPVIKNITPSTGSPGSKIEIQGTHIIPDATSIIIGENTASKANPLQSSYTHVEAQLPLYEESSSVPIHIEVAGVKSNTFTLEYEYPKITSLDPVLAHTGDTVRLMGDHLNHLPGNIQLIPVSQLGIPEIGEVTVLNKADGFAWFIFPSNICPEDQLISVIYENDLEMIMDLFDEPVLNMREPEIQSVHPNIIEWGSTIQIGGNYFPDIDQQRVSVSVQGVEAELVSYDTQNISFHLPSDIVSVTGLFDIEVGFCDQKFIKLNDSLTIPAPVIDSIRPQNPAPGEEIMVYGKHFNPDIDYSLETYNNSLNIQGVTEIDMHVEDRTKFTVDLPLDLEDGEYSFNVVTNGMASESYPVQIKAHWKKQSTLPVEIGNRPIAFAIGNKIYFGGGKETTHQHFYEYNPETYIFTQLNDMPTSINTGVAMTNETIAYIVDSDGFYAYNPILDEWTELENPNVNLEHYAHAGALIGNTVHFNRGAYFHHEYNITTGNWTLHTIPISQGNYGIITAFAIGDKLYINHHHLTGFVYNTSTNQWKSFSGKYTSSNTYKAFNGFSYNDKGYYFNYNQFFIYDPFEDQWSETVRTLNTITGPVAVRIDNKAYIISGHDSSNGILEFLLDGPK